MSARSTTTGAPLPSSATTPVLATGWRKGMPSSVSVALHAGAAQAAAIGACVAPACLRPSAPLRRMHACGHWRLCGTCVHACAVPLAAALAAAAPTPAPDQPAGLVLLERQLGVLMQAPGWAGGVRAHWGGPWRAVRKQVRQRRRRGGGRWLLAQRRSSWPHLLMASIHSSSSTEPQAGGSRAASASSSRARSPRPCRPMIAAGAGVRLTGCRLGPAWKGRTCM